MMEKLSDLVAERDRAIRTMQWGIWKLVADDYELVAIDPELGQIYAVDLEEFTDSAMVLNSIFQVRAKTWANDKIIFDLLCAIQDVFDPQSTLCGFGQSGEIEDPCAVVDWYSNHNTDSNNH